MKKGKGFSTCLRSIPPDGNRCISDAKEGRRFVSGTQPIHNQAARIEGAIVQARRAHLRPRIRPKGRPIRLLLIRFKQIPVKRCRYGSAATMRA